MAFNRWLRRIFPSTSRLTYSPVFKLLVNGADLFPSLLFKEFRELPPNHLRIRVGVGNRIVLNQLWHMHAARNWWWHALQAGWCGFNSTIVDIGCGCGRWAMHMRDYNFRSEKFSGKYYGIDIDEEMIDWCRRNFDSERFEFILSSDRSVSYHKEHGAAEPFHIPLPDSSADLVFSTSLFTHLLEKELNNYIGESFRLLRPGGYMAHNCYGADLPLVSYGDRHTFAHRVGNAHVESQQQPEAAVAYPQAYLLEAARAAGFHDPKILYAPTHEQPILVCQKPAAAAATQQT